jgi:DNA gyrase/topoisomerase IV subunit A
MRRVITDEEPNSDGMRLQLLEAQLTAAENGPQLAAIAQASESRAVAIKKIMKDFSFTELQAATVLDSQYRLGTAEVRGQIAREIEEVRRRLL